MAMDPNVKVPQDPSVPNAPPLAESAGVDLSPEAYALIRKGTKDEVISLLSHPGDARDGLHLIVLAALIDAGVITKANLHDQIVGPMDQYFRDRGYEAMTEVERHESPGA